MKRTVFIRHSLARRQPVVRHPTRREDVMRRQRLITRRRPQTLPATGGTGIRVSSRPVPNECRAGPTGLHPRPKPTSLFIAEPCDIGQRNLRVRNRRTPPEKTSLAGASRAKDRDGDRKERRTHGEKRPNSSFHPWSLTCHSIRRTPRCQMYNVGCGMSNE